MSSKLENSRSLDEADTIAILYGLMDYRLETGAPNPSRSQIQPFYDFIIHSLHSSPTPSQLHNKLRHLKHKYRHTTLTPSHSPHDRLVFELSHKAWGNNTPTNNADNHVSEEKQDDDDDGDECFKYLEHEAREYWKKASGFDEETLEMGMRGMDRGKAKALDKKWRQHLEAELKVQKKRCELNKELYAAVFAAHKDMNR